MSEWERAYGGFARLAWGHGLPCLVVDCETRDRRPGSVNMIECAHVRTGGMGRKADARWSVFTCWRHHDEMDNGRRSFVRKYRDRMAVDGIPVVDLLEAAEVTEEAWQRTQGVW